MGFAEHFWLRHVSAKILMSDDTMHGLQISAPYYAYEFSLPAVDRNFGGYYSTSTFMSLVISF